ncbi:MAG TPA: DUF1552 domain-containing protein [Planctomycetota bacterium]|nr:DUF1552 domain-containing protein [Planctomycetota bacterium]
MSRSKVMDRRTALKGVGVAIGLPLLEAMMPSGIFGGSASAEEKKSALAAAGMGGSSSKTPVRLAFVAIPNGMWMDHFTPKTVGPLTDLPPSLKPLEALRGDFSILSGLAQDNARAKGDGPGDHARSAAAFLTGAHPFKTAGSNIKLGISVDQVAAKSIGQQTQLPSLELGCDVGRKAGECDSGYACAYVSNISWADETTPMPKLVDPAAVFERLFGKNTGQFDMARKMAERKSILDYVRDDTKRLEKQVGSADQKKLDEFTTSLRELERRIENNMKNKEAVAPPPGFNRPTGIPKEYSEHLKLMYDMMIVAFQTDCTRVCTFQVASEGSNRSFNFIGVSGAHHELSHHGKKPDNVEAIKKIDHFYMSQFGYFLQRMKAVKEGSGTLLDNCLIMMGSGIGDGDRHNHDDLPILLAGKGGGTVVPGRHVQYPKNTPLCNLFVSMLQRAKVNATRFADSTGPLPQLS